MRLPEMKPIRPRVSMRTGRHGSYIVRWTITDGIQRESYEQPIMAENKMKARAAWETWYETNRQGDDRDRGWYVESSVVREEAEWHAAGGEG